VHDFPATATWRHLGAREGFEALFPARGVGGHRLEGWSTGVEDGRAWGVRYAIVLDDDGTTREARVECRSAGGARAVQVEGDGRGGWLVNGAPAPHLDGCLDVDLEASAFTNAFPVRRLRLGVGGRADAPAAWVRAPGLAVERLEQTYERLPDDGRGARYRYAAPALGFAAVLACDGAGLVLHYPGIAVRTS
jgi:uncharacterized protein